MPRWISRSRRAEKRTANSYRGPLSGHGRGTECLFVTERMGSIAETDVRTIVVVGEEIRPLHYSTTIVRHCHSSP